MPLEMKNEKTEIYCFCEKQVLATQEDIEKYPYKKDVCLRCGLIA